MRIGVGMMNERARDSSHNAFVAQFDMKLYSMRYKTSFLMKIDVDVGGVIYSHMMPRVWEWYVLTSKMDNTLMIAKYCNVGIYLKFD